MGMLLSSLALLLLVFWAGRASAPGKASGNEEPNPRRLRSADRSDSRDSAKRSGPGAGGQAITSALQLRDFYKNSGGNHELATAQADLVLSKMNAAELSRLVQDLAVAQAENPGYGFTLEIGTACSRWAQVDPDGALNFVLSAKQASFRTSALGSLFAGMAKTNPARALEAFRSLPSGQIGSDIEREILSNLAQRDPDAALDAALASASEDARSQGVSDAFRQLTQKDPESARRRLATLPAGSPEHEIALTSLTSQWASRDPAAARDWVAGLKGVDQSSAFKALIPAMSQNSPALAAETLGTLLQSTSGEASGDLADCAVSIVNQWTRVDPEAAMTWIDSLPAGQSRDDAVDFVVGNNRIGDLGTSLEWAASIRDEGRRADLMSSLVQRWKEKDPDKVRAAINQANLSPGVRADLLGQLK